MNVAQIHCVMSSQKEVILTMHSVTYICTRDHMRFSPAGASTYTHAHIHKIKCAKIVIHVHSQQLHNMYLGMNWQMQIPYFLLVKNRSLPLFGTGT